MNGPKARIVLLAIAITAAVAAFAVRGRPGIARVAAAPVESPGGSAAPILVEQDALYRAVRVARAVEGHGWVSAREDGLGPALLAEGAPPASEDQGAPIPWAPGYDLFLAAVHRRAFPSFAQLLADESERAPAPAPDAGERARIERWVAAAPPLLAALTALLAALLAALVTPGAGASAAAAVAGLGVAFATAHVDATARGSGSAAGWVGLLLTGALLVTVRGWMQPRINQPFWSSVRGGIAGLLAGLAVASDAAALLPVALLQLTFLARLLLPFRDAEGRAVPARSFPVFVTSFHKVALLVLLPATVENPFVAGDPMGVVGVTWLPLALLGAGWLAFAPFALVPRLVGRRPVMALIPAALLAGAVLLGTDAPARVASLLDTERWSSPSRSRGSWRSPRRSCSAARPPCDGPNWRPCCSSAWASFRSRAAEASRPRGRWRRRPCCSRRCSCPWSCGGWEAPPRGLPRRPSASAWCSRRRTPARSRRTRPRPRRTAPSTRRPSRPSSSRSRAGTPRALP